MTTATGTPYFCVNRSCRLAGYPTPKPTCITCGRTTHHRDEPGVAVPEPRPRRADDAPALGPRLLAGGAWSVAAVGACIGGALMLGRGDGNGLVLIGVSVLAGVCAIYTLRGGRLGALFR